MVETARQGRGARDETWFVTRKYPPRIGGMESLSWQLTTRLGERRPSRVLALRRGSFWLPLFLVRSTLLLLVGAARGRIALLHLGDPVLAPLGRLARLCGVPACVTVHGLDVTYAHPLYRLWLRVFFQDLDAYICISAAARDAAIARGAPAARTCVIGIGLAPPAGTGETTAREVDLLLFVGRLVRRKGLGWFVKHVLPKLAARRPGIRLAIVGAGPERVAVERAAAEVGASHRLIWLGALPEVDKWTWYRRASLCIMPNVPVLHDIEGFGLAALEAAAAGCPLVAADLEGLRDAIEDGEAGVLVGAGDTDAWVSAVLRLLDSFEARRMLGERARAWVRAHRGWEAVCDRYEALFASLEAGAV
ncbi:MAG: glycosyltransferase family 4 protein [Pseudomonadota bacterium]|nr:glycosyltransferase family 4 protein [Pseudomonadota bacterium]